MIRIDTNSHINPADVSHMTWDRSFYVNGSASKLVITMIDGRTYRVEHTAGYLDGIDAYAVEKAILQAFEKAGAA